MRKMVLMIEASGRRGFVGTLPTEQRCEVCIALVGEAAAIPPRTCMFQCELERLDGGLYEYVRIGVRYTLKRANEVLNML